jgi:phage terminase small subunit
MIGNVSSDGISEQQQQLTAKQQKLITSLLSGIAIIDASKDAGISEKTAHAWLKLPHVHAAYQEAQQTIFDETLRLLMSDVNDARLTLRTIMKDESAPHGNRVRAAQIIFEQAMSIHKMSELDQKIAALEAIVQERIK